METMRLRAIQQPSQVEALLESFVSRQENLPFNAYRVMSYGQLSGGLQRVAIRAQKEHHAWGSWTDDHRTWFFTAEMSLPLSRERGRPVLQLNSYGEDGQLIESALWLSMRDGGWQRCVV